MYYECDGKLKKQKLKKFLKREDIEAEFFEFSEPTLTVEDSASQLDVEANRIVKSLVFEDEKSQLILAIVSGDVKVDEEKLSEIHGFEVKMAKAREVEDLTGYKVGEVPPVGHGLKTYIDSEIKSFEEVIGGGGSTHTLMKISPEEIIRVTDSEIGQITR